MANVKEQVYEFDVFRLDASNRLLFRDQELIELPPKTIDLLLVLVERSGQVVTKKELLDAVWPGTFIEEGILAKNVTLIRKALGEGADDNRYIRTVPKRGYQFVAELRPREEPAKSDPPAPPPPPPPPVPKWLVIAAIVAAAAVLAAATAYAAYRWWPRHEPIRSLAVLPLENLSNDPAKNDLADGLHETLINYLCRIGALRTISRTSVMSYKGTHKALPKIADELNIDAVVEGSVQSSGDRVRVSVQLIEARTEKPLWADSYEGELRDVLALESTVASAIAREIQVKLNPQEKAHLAQSRQVNPEAYLAYSRGRDFWNKRTAEGITRSIQSFQEAIQKDPNFAPAHSGLADAYAILGSIGSEAMEPRKAWPMAKAEAMRALAIDDSLAEGHTSLAYIKLSYDWDWTGAEAEFKRAIELNPGYATAHHWYSHYFLAMGRVEEAKAEMTLAQQRDPHSPIINVGVGWSLYLARQYDQAIEQYHKTLELDPDYVFAHYALGLAYGRKQMYEDAIEEFKKTVKLLPKSAVAIGGLGNAYAMAGQRNAALAQLAALTTLSRSQYVPALANAFVYVGLGDANNFFYWAGRALNERSDYLIYLRVDPVLDDIRSDPRFADLLKELRAQPQ